MRSCLRCHSLSLLSFLLTSLPEHLPHVPEWAVQCASFGCVPLQLSKDMFANRFLTPFIRAPPDLSASGDARRRSAMHFAAWPSAPANSGRAAPALLGPEALPSGPAAGFPGPAAEGARSSRESSPAIALRASAVSTVHAPHGIHVKLQRPCLSASLFTIAWCMCVAALHLCRCRGRHMMGRLRYKSSLPSASAATASSCSGCCLVSKCMVQGAHRLCDTLT